MLNIVDVILYQINSINPLILFPLGLIELLSLSFIFVMIVLTLSELIDTIILYDEKDVILTGVFLVRSFFVGTIIFILSCIYLILIPIDIILILIYNCKYKNTKHYLLAYNSIDGDGYPIIIKFNSIPVFYRIKIIKNKKLIIK